MERVLARRDENWKKMQQYILDEEERLQSIGPDGTRLYGFDRDYTWFIRAGLLRPQPAQVRRRHDQRERTRATGRAQWIEREKAREKRAQERAKERGEERRRATATAHSISGSAPPSTMLLTAVARAAVRLGGLLPALQVRSRPLRARRPRAADDRDVLRIEYYPSKLFTEGRTRPEQARPRARRSRSKRR